MADVRVADNPTGAGGPASGESKSDSAVPPPVPPSEVPAFPANMSAALGGIGTFGAADTIVRDACIVIQVPNTPESLAFLKNRIVAGIVKADLRFGLFYSSDRQSVFCKVYATRQRLLIEADRRNYVLKLDKAALRKADIEVNGELQKRGLIFDYAPNPDREANKRNVPGPPLKLRGDELAIPEKNAKFFKTRDPYAHVYAKFDLPSSDPEELRRLALFRAHALDGSAKADHLRRRRDRRSGSRAGSASGLRAPLIHRPGYTHAERLLESGRYSEIAFDPITDSSLSVLKTTDALKLIVMILKSRDDGPGTGAHLKLDRWVMKEKVLNWFPLHDPTKHRVKDLLLSAYPWNVPVKPIRKYYGEKVGMYFVFLAHFTQWLTIPALIGLIAFINQIAAGDPNISWLPTLGILITLWSTLFLESHKREITSYAMEWGMTEFEEEEELRPEFCSDPVTFLVRSPLHGKPTFWSSKALFIRRMITSYLVVGTMIAIVVAAVFSIFVFRVKLEQEEEHGHLPKGFGNYIASFINSIQILVLNKVYVLLAHRLTQWENHPTDTSFEDALIFKTATFQFVNSYFSMFYIAFIKSHLVLWGSHQQCKPGSNGKPDCMRELQINLGVVLVTRLFVGNFTEVLLPRIIRFLKAFAKRCFGKGASTPERELPAIEKEAIMKPYATFDDYLEMLLLYGYVTLFVVAFPLAPLLGLINNCVEIRVDGFKLLMNSSRPAPRGAEDIGAWYRFLDVITYMSVFTNLGVVIFTDTTDFWGLHSQADKIYMFLFLEHGVFLLKYLLSHFVPDVPADVSLQLQRQKYLVDKHLNGIPDEVDDFDENDPNRLATADLVQKQFHIHESESTGAHQHHSVQ